MTKNPLTAATITAEDVPTPECGPGHVLLQNRYSLISAGTESAAVRRTVRDMIVKGLTAHEIRSSVKDMLFAEGLRKTAERVRFETSKWTPLGYSGCGVALEVGSQIEGIQIGDLVAYAGAGHAECVRAAKNLCVRVPDGVAAREASFVALGSIALQAVRRADVQVGDICAVIGLGLVGQLVSQLLQTAGARVFGSDPVPGRVDLARRLGAEYVSLTNPQIPDEFRRETQGRGVDRAIICASGGRDVVDQAVAMLRDRGRIVVVGMIDLNVPCEEAYRKELDLVISRSYGPGRYDHAYEEHGTDYPIGYVRWTERRNMEEFLRLVQAGRVKVDPLITHDYPLPEADQAYAMLVNQPATSLGVVLRYGEADVPVTRTMRLKASRSSMRLSRPINVAVIGCGSFARQFHLPNLRNHSDLNLRLLVASTGHNAKEMAKRYDAEHCSTSFDEALSDPAVDALFVLTRDNLHAGMTIAGLQAGKHVFCEKPLATNEEECRLFEERSWAESPLCMVGFNRRFAPLAIHAKRRIERRRGNCMITYRVNAGSLPRQSWIFDAAHAKGRIVGEVCHFVDLLGWLLDAELVKIFAQSTTPAASLASLEDVTTVLTFSDGSTATLLYTAKGTATFSKERLEIYDDGQVIVLDDYRTLTIRGRSRGQFSRWRTDKGHAQEIAHFAQAIRGAEPLLVTHEDGVRATRACLKLYESVQTGLVIPMDPPSGVAAAAQ